MSGRPSWKSAKIGLFRPFPEGAESTWEIQKTEEKGLFPQISSDLLKYPSLKPPFAALQLCFCIVRIKHAVAQLVIRDSRFKSQIAINQMLEEGNSVCDPLCCKSMCCTSRFWTGGREAGSSRSKNLPEGLWKQMLGQGHTLRLLDEAREVGCRQHPGPENQDSQHMIDQPRGSFPEK